MNSHKASGVSVVHVVALAIGLFEVGCIPDLQPAIPLCGNPILAQYVDISDELRTPELQRAVASLTSLNGVWIATLHCSFLGDPPEREIRVDLQGLSSANVRVVTETQRDPAGAPRLECAPAGSFIVDSTATLNGVDDVSGSLANCSTAPSMSGNAELFCDFGSVRGGDIEKVKLTLRAVFDVDAGGLSVRDGVLIYLYPARQLSSDAYQKNFWTCSIPSFRRA